MKRIFKSKKSVAITIISLLLVVLLSANVISAMFLSYSLFKRDGWKKFEEYSYGGQLKSDFEWIKDQGEEIQLENEDGKVLNAIEVKNEHVSHSYMIICHQYGGSPETVTEYAKHFYELGFNVVMPYMRGHGKSPYKTTSFGWADRLDIKTWVESIIKKDEKAKIALFGISMGANAVTLAASENLPSNVRLVISDGCYTSLDALIKEYIKNETRFSSIISVPIISTFAEKKIGVSLKQADTIEAIRDIELPIMFINGESDAVVPPLVNKRLYENCDAEGVEEVIIEKGAHGRNLEVDKATYWSNVDTFILNNLGM